jgi:hypothetical protein
LFSCYLGFGLLRKPAASLRGAWRGISRNSYRTWRHRGARNWICGPSQTLVTTLPIDPGSAVDEHGKERATGRLEDQE